MMKTKYKKQDKLPVQNMTKEQLVKISAAIKDNYPRCPHCNKKQRKFKTRTNYPFGKKSKSATIAFCKYCRKPV